MDKRTIAGLAALGAVLGAAAATGVVISKKRKKRLLAEKSETLLPKKNIYFAGGGIAALSGAFYLIHDCKVPGECIHIFEASSNLGGSFNVGGNSEDGFITALTAPLCTDSKSNLGNMLSVLPSVNLPGISVAEEIRSFEDANPLDEFSRLVDSGCLEVTGMGVSNAAKKQIKSLLSRSEEDLEDVSIHEFFIDAPDFLMSNLWGVISTTYLLKPDSAAQELKHILSSNSVSELFEMKGMARTQLNIQETVITALIHYLSARNVNFSTHCRVIDLDFEESCGRVCAIHLNDNGTAKTFYLNKNDLCFVTNGSASECATVGDYNYPAPQHDDAPASMALWRNISGKREGLGKPEAFFASDRTEVISFTITAKSTLLLDCIKQYASGSTSCGTLTTFTDSPWGLTVMTPPQPYFLSQDDNCTVICGYGVNVTEEGKYIDKSMKDSSGAEILFELVKHLHLEERWDEITDDIINVIPCAMPYASAASLPHENDDKPLVIPFKDGNIAFIGRFARLGCGISGSSEYAVRTAREAAYRLTGTKKSSAAPPRNGVSSYLKLFLDLKKD